MILVIDCGNTNTVFALYSYDNSIKKTACWRIHNNTKRTADSYYSWLSHMLKLSEIKIDDVLVFALHLWLMKLFLILKCSLKNISKSTH